MWKASNRWARGRRTAFPTAALAVAVLALASCDFAVTNPGPIHDVNLDDPGPHSAVVTGARAAALRSLSEFAITGGGISRDFHAGGHTGWAGVSLLEELGQLDEQTSQGEGWEQGHTGRFIGEHMAARIRETMGAEAESYAPLGQFLLWAGFANRILGENVCHAVLDGAPESWSAHFTRAVQQFTEAAEVFATVGNEDLRLAAIGGLASAHLYLGNWSEAAEAAVQIPLDYTFKGDYKSNNPDFYWITDAATITFKSLTFWYHPFEDYFPASGDPRAAWGHDPDEEPDVARPTWAEIIPMYYPIKFYRPRSPNELTEFNPDDDLQHEININLVSGREMLLIRAEAALAQNDMPGAVDLMNQLRQNTANYFTGDPLDPLTPANATEAWAALKFERLLELNLEGRRFGDRKRWAVSGTPGDLDPLEYIPDHHVERFGVPKVPDVCFPIPRTEKQSNPNIPADFQDEVVSG